MLTDENDCSIIDGGQAYLTGKVSNGFHLPRATSACETKPQSSDCKSCGMSGTSNAPDCQLGPLTKNEDPAALRCYRQKQRFGVDLLYPTSRYVDGLTSVTFADGTYNPVFCIHTSDDRKSCNDFPRDRSWVLLGAITGVPWQDLAVDPTDLTKSYRSARELSYTPEQLASNGSQPVAGLPANKTLWDLIIGNPEQNIESLDPLMVESINPRSGISPITNTPLAQPGDKNQNPINGTERALQAGSDSGNDLQYACRFPLPTPRDCAKDSCDCDEPNNPLCRNPVTGVFDPAHEYFAKAYPGRRQLAVLEGLGDQAIVTSICAAETANEQSSIYGYRPAIQAIVDRAKSTLKNACLTSELSLDSQAISNQCAIVEARRGDANEQGAPLCSCDAEDARSDLPADINTALDKYLEDSAPEMNCACEINQVSTADLKACITNSNDQVNGIDGWCLVDMLRGGSSVAMGDCRESRTIRMLGKGKPAAQTLTFLACKGMSGTRSTI
jgi:hypothetical protein